MIYYMHTICETDIYIYIYIYTYTYTHICILCKQYCYYRRISEKDKWGQH